MGTDAFHVCYGLRWDIDGADEEVVELLERREDPRVQAARAHGLGHWWGDTADEGRCFLIVGTIVGNFGWEGKHGGRLNDAELAQVMDRTRQKLRAAGFDHEPAWFFQFEPDL